MRPASSGPTNGRRRRSGGAASTDGRTRALEPATGTFAEGARRFAAPTGPFLDVAETFAGPGTVDVSISGLPSLVVPAGAEPRRILSECLAG